MTLEYLEALTALMRKRADEITGEEDEEDAELEEMTVDAIVDVLRKALPAYAVPTAPAFTRHDIPMLDAWAYGVFYGFSFRGLSFELRFTLGTDRHSNRRFLGFEPVTTIMGVTLTCEGVDSKGGPFESTWDSESAQWSNPLPLD